ncbi:MAG: phosphoribosyl-AMP cyclohydrolase [Acidimicrobiales bacterium]
MSAAIEENLVLALDFDKINQVAAGGQAVVPVVLQHVDNGQVLFVGYANELALRTSMQEHIAVLWSTSRDELWRKGATSGDVLELSEVRVNCEQNSLLYLVRPVNPGVCHTVGDVGVNRPSCFYRAITDESELALVPAQD